MDIDLLDILARIGVAVLCGALLGWEREARDKPAGLRTTMLVALGAATATVAAMELHYDVLNSSDGVRAVADPIRVVSGVIGGLGFLGAGAIIQGRGDVRGMTTAATIWVVGGIGVACGLGYFEIALPSVSLAFLVLLGVGKFEHSRFAPKSVRKVEDAQVREESFSDP